MKRFLTSVKQEGGFTLIELMVVVAIIGLLSAVAIPNFKKYQAKSKITEAKLQLSAIYTAETAFFSDYNMYAGCLRYMGYDPVGERANRYFATGFPTGVQVINAAAALSAANSGMGTDCDTTAAVTDGTKYYTAGKGIGGMIIDTVGKMTGNAAGASVACTSLATAVGSCVSTQEDNTNMAWQAAAVGTISGDFITASGVDAAGLNINEKKILRTQVQGY